MNSTEHLSRQTLELLLESKLPESDRVTSGLHLSYCPLCRARKDELNLKLAAERMWASASAKEHIDNATFERFWRAEIEDEEVLKTISHHCVACAECRQRRDFARSSLDAKRSIFVALVLTVIKKAWQRRSTIALVALALGLLTALVVMFAPSRLRQQALNPPTPTPTPEEKQSTPPSQSPESTPPKDLLAQVQMIDLTTVPDGDDSRSPDVTSKTKPDFSVTVSNSGPTPLRIALPQNSKNGRYRVTIRDRAFLNEIVRARGVSRNGRTLNISVNFSRIKNGVYVLRLEREAPGTGHPEYVGDYEVAVTR